MLEFKFPLDAYIEPNKFIKDVTEELETYGCSPVSVTLVGYALRKGCNTYSVQVTEPLHAFYFGCAFMRIME